MTNLKKQLHEKCSEITTQRVQDLKSIIKEAQDAANNETKSSAGDKHETGRAMAQLETEKLSKQLSEALKLEQTLTQINPDIKHSTIGLGSLALTDNGFFYISVSLGQVKIEETTYFAISSASPIGQLLNGLKINDSFSFNGRSYLINEIV